MDGSSANKRVVVEFFGYAATGDPRLMELVTPDLEWVIAAADEPQSRELIPWIGRTFRGTEGLVEFVSTVFSGDYFEMLELRANDFVADGETVVAFGNWKYKVRRTGQIVQSAFAARITLKEGKIAKYFFFENTLAVALALGSLPGSSS